MWFLIILFIPIAILLVALDEYLKKKKKNKEYEELQETIDDLQYKYNETNNFIQEVEKTNNIEDKNDNKHEDNYYDDNVSNEEIEQAMKNIKSDELLTNEIIFLKFMNNKEISIKFSPRWEFIYELRPRIVVAKLMKLEYLTYSSWYDNVKNATMKELKEILKSENLKVSGNKQELVKRILGNVNADLLEEKFNNGKYILTEKGRKILEKNKRLFMSDREKAGEEFAELTDYEYNFLEELKITREYVKIRQEMLSINNSYTTEDILWTLLNTVKDTFLLNKKYEKASYIYDKMFRICFDEKRYLDALIFLLCSSYLEGYNTIKEIKEEDQFDMEDWFEINIYDISDRVRIIEEKTSIIKDKGIDWLILNSIDKYLKSISNTTIRRAFKNKLTRIFNQLLYN